MNVRDEDGQALMLALAFLIFFGLVIGAMLAFAGASVLSTERLREQRSTDYTADGATDPLPGGHPDGGDGPDPADIDRHHDRCDRRERHLHMVAASVPTRTDGDVHDVRRGWFVAGGPGDRAVPRHPEPGYGQRALLDLLWAQHVVLRPRDLRSYSPVPRLAYSARWRR